MSSKSVPSKVEARAKATECFALFDSADQLVSFNEAFRDMMAPSSGNQLAVGMSFEALLRRGVKHGLYDIADGDLELFVAARLRDHKNLPSAREHQLNDGRWVRVSEHQTHDGGTVLMQMDITDRVSATHEAAEAQAMLVDAVESLSDGFVLFDSKDRLVSYNSAYGKMVDAAAPGSLVIGLSFEELLRNWVEVGAYELTDAERSAFFEKRLATHRNPPSHHKHQLSDGRWLLNGEYPTTSGGTVLIQHDITDMKKIEDALKSSEARFSGILDIAPEAIIATDDRGLIRVFNQGAGNIFGYREDEVLGKPVEMLMPENFRAAHGGLMAGFGVSSVQQRPMSERGEIVGLRKDKTTFPADASISKLVHDNETIFNVILRDITQQKRTEHSLIDAKEAAEVASRSKSEFLANMSHELRTPLNAINGFSEVILKQLYGELGDPRYLEYVGHIHESGTHLLSVINDILDLSRIEAGKKSLQEETFELGEVLAACIRFLEHRIEVKELRITIPPDSAWPELHADRRLVRQMMLNLLSNAIKFSLPSASIDVSGQFENDGGFAIIVSDTGIGMAEDEIAIALEPFGQVENTWSRENEGTGLGLPLVKSQIELHGGTFKISSEKDVGTQVGLVFPAERVVIKN